MSEPQPKNPLAKYIEKRLALIENAKQLVKERDEARAALDKAERRLEDACYDLDHYGDPDAAERYWKQTRRAQIERGAHREANEE